MPAPRRTAAAIESGGGFRGKSRSAVGIAIVSTLLAGGFACRPGGPTRYAVDRDAGELRAFRVAPARDGSRLAIETAPTLKLGGERRVERAGDFELDVAAVADRSQPVALAFAFGVRPPEPGKPEGVTRFRVDGAGEPFERVVGAADLASSGVLPVGAWHEAALELDPATLPARLRFHVESDRRPASGAPDVWAWGDVHLVPLAKAGGEERGAAAGTRSLLLVSIDTLRADRLSLYGRSPSVTTPRLDAWARRRATAFDQAIAASPWTLPSHMTIFSGLDATRHGVENEGTIAGIRQAARGRTFPLLAERLRDAGFRTGASTGGGMVAAQFGFAAGFDVYRSWSGPQSERAELESGVDAALRWFRAERGRRTFYFLHTYRVHSPFERDFEPDADGKAEPPLDVVFDAPDDTDGYRNDAGRITMQDPATGEWRRRDDPGAVDELNDAYDMGVRSADAAIGGLLERLEAEGLDRDLAIVVTSDHGEALGRHGAPAGDGSRARLGHHDLHDGTIRVPLLVSIPGGAPRRVATQVRHVDLLPTLLEAVGLPPPEAPDRSDGVSLLGFARGESPVVPTDAWSAAAAWNQGVSLRSGGLKLLLDDVAWRKFPSSGSTGRFSWVDLERDPGERSPIPFVPGTGAARLPAEVERLAAAARERAGAAAGLWLRFENDGPAAERFRLRAPELVNDAFKLVDDGARFDFVKGEGVDVTLPAGARSRVRWTRVPRTSLRITPMAPLGSVGPSSKGSGRSFPAATIRADDLARGFTLLWSGSHWYAASSGHEKARVRIEFSWSGPIDPTAPPLEPYEDHEADEEQLRALGYLG